jgi:hypothetical protein
MRRLQAKAAAQSQAAPQTSPCTDLLVPGRSLTEHLLTSPDGFGITTATPAQRAACRIIDGRPLGELANDPAAVQLVGGASALSALPSERGIVPPEVVFLAAIRCAKTIIATCAAIRMALTVDVSRLGPGEVPRVSVVSLKLDLAQVAYGLAVETIRASKTLGPLLTSDKAGVLTVRHPTGRPVELAIVAGARAGSGLVSRWAAGVIFDEAPRMSGADDAVVNLDDARTAVQGRLLPGAQILYIGSPWAPFGPVYKLVQERWQKPTDTMVVLRGTGPMLNPVTWTPERCEKLRQSNPAAYTTDVLGEFADPEAGMFSPVAIASSTRVAPLELPLDRECTYAAAIDPSEGSATGNAWTLVIVERRDGPRTRYRVALAREFRGVRPVQCWQEIAACCDRYGVSECVTDQYAAAANADLAAQHGLELDVRPATAASKLEDFTNLQTLLHSDCIELPPDEQLRADLASVRRRATQSGMAIVLPRTGDGRHCDYAPALVAAVKAASSQDGDDEVIGIPGAWS